MHIENPSLQTWEEKLNYLSEDGKWFDDQFVKFSAFFLERDIVIHTSTGDIKYCGSPYHTEGDSRVDNNCTFIGPSIHIANIGDYHFQSIIPINQGNSGISHQVKSNKKNNERKIHICKLCGYSTTKTSNFTRHELSCKKKQEYNT